MSFLNFLTGTAGYTAILAAFGLAVAAHFFAPRAWSALAWTIAFGVLGAAFVGQREITASVRIEAAEQAKQRADEARAVAEATDKLRTAVHAWRDAQTAFLSTLDARITKEVSDAVEENNRRRSAVAAGTVRVRYVAARLNAEPRIHSYVIESENFESIHNHSAYALIEKVKQKAE